MLDHYPKICAAWSWGAAQWIAKFCNGDWGDAPKNKNNLNAIYQAFHTRLSIVEACFCQLQLTIASTVEYHERYVLG